MDLHTNGNEVNDVKGWSGQNSPVSSGRDRHALQVTPDRHQAPVVKKNYTKTKNRNIERKNCYKRASWKT